MGDCQARWVGDAVVLPDVTPLARYDRTIYLAIKAALVNRDNYLDYLV